MRNFLENIKTLIVEIIGLVGGLIWAKHSNWDYEPLILVAVSFIGLIIFILLKFISNDEDKPIVELEFVRRGTTRLPPGLIANISPKNETGESYVFQIGGTYLFQIERRFDLVIRNNSKNNAYNLTLYKIKDSYPITFKTKQKKLEPLMIDKPKIIEFTYEVYRAMTHDDADKILNAVIPEDFKNLIIVAKYQSESRKTYYTKFTPLANNEHLKNFSLVNHYDEI